MAQDEIRPAIGGGTNGGTGGTGPTEAVAEGGALAEAERDIDGDSLAGGDDSVDGAIGGTFDRADATEERLLAAALAPAQTRSVAHAS